MWHFKDRCFVGLVLIFASWLLVNMVLGLKGRSSFSCFTPAWPWDYLLIKDSCVPAPREQEYLYVQFRVLLICKGLSGESPHQPLCFLTSSPGLASSGDPVLGQFGASETLHRATALVNSERANFLYLYLNVQWAI